MMMTVMHDQDSQSEHIQIERLADGVYAAIHRRGGAAIGNAGIVDLGDRTLVYDTFFTPQAARDLRAAAEGIGGRPVDLAINSHYHNDHIWGNQVFGEETGIVSTVETRRLVSSKGMDELRSFEGHAAAELETLLAQQEAAGDEIERHRLSFWIDYYRAYVEAEPRISIRQPDLTFSERLVIHGSERLAELIPFSGAHSGSDLVLWLPQERIAFMSDLLFVACHPYLAEGDPESMLTALRAVRNLEPRLLVPGHGPPGTPRDLDLMVDYVSALDNLARDLVQDGVGPDELDRHAVPELFVGWDMDRFFVVNLRAFYQRHQDRAAGDPA